MMTDDTGYFLEVTDIKQHRICPRVVFYRYCLPRVRPITGKMALGIERHREEIGREERRSLRAYGLTSGERQFDCLLRSTRYRLVGMLDLIIITENECIPVEYKLSERMPGSHVKAQLAAYALLLTEQLQKPVRRGFSYLLPLRKAVEIPLGQRLLNDVERSIEHIHQMIAHEAMPPAPKQQAICVNCEFRRFCNDVL
ncbi:CRISPR-associated protein Cas4 [Herpetosiphon llansteffanensis]|uniref:CRISPR-associated protein Cas4 n=1 Tax=Herpetosiphon llansteffanensis TaxID=2094568 RepID=UPI000D7C45CC|nr:CRISPR-associated protein Cas4 [Herpetosiphon llansteffanensis]